MILIGSEGVIELYNDETLVLKKPNQEAETLTISGEQNQFMGAQAVWLAKVKDAVQNGESLRPSFADGLATARVLEQLRQSFG